MRITPALSIMLLFALPFASAGGLQGSVSTDTSSDSCESSSTSDSWWWSYEDNTTASWGSASSSSEESRCDSEFSTMRATASDDEGEIAYANVGGADWESTASSGSGYSSGYYDWSSQSGGWGDAQSQDESEAQGWSRDTTVRVVGQEATASRGCASEFAYGSAYQSSSYYSDPYSSSQSSGQGNWNWNSGCHESAGATFGGRSAGAALVNGCDYNAAWTDNTYWYGSSAWGGGEGQGTSSCWSLVVANAAGESVTAGRRDVCEDEYRYDARSDGENWTVRDESISDCRNGYVVEGPTGMMFFAGSQDHQERSCEYDENYESACGESGSRSSGVELTWAQNPVGPGPMGFFIPLV